MTDEYEGLSSSFAAACRKADEKQRRKPIDLQIEKLRRAAESTVEALMLGLRERGIGAVQEPKVRSRLAQLSEDQLIEVGDRLQRLKPEIARAWSPDDVAALASAWKGARS